MDQLHTLDLSQFHSGDEFQRSEFCQKLLASFRENGFVKLINHGLSAEYVTEGLEYVRIGSHETRRDVANSAREQGAFRAQQRAEE